MQKDAEKWLQKARADLRSARYNLKGAEFETAAFMAQQAAEKALKAKYIQRFNTLNKTHDLVLLARELQIPEKLIEFCKELTPAYVYTRYPDVAEISNMDEVAEKLISYASEVIQWIEKN